MAADKLMTGRREDQEGSLENDTAREFSTNEAAQGLAEQELPFRIDEDVEVQLPEFVKGIDDQEHDDQRINQELMFAIREALLATPGGAKLGWIPQAIEGYLRTNHIAFTEWGRIRRIKVAKSGEIELDLNLNLDHIKKPQTISLSTRELVNSSVELMLDGVEVGTEKISYSADMDKAVSALSPSAQYRWEMITKAAKAQAEAKNNESGRSFKVKGVAREMFADPEGVGIFTKYSGRFSAVKVTLDDVPMTAKEMKLLEQALALRRYRDHFSKDFFDQCSSIYRALEFLEKDESAFSRFWKRMAKGDKSISAAREFQKLYKELMEFNSRLWDPVNDIQVEIYSNKGKFAKENPFETVELSEETKKRIHAVVTKLLVIVEKLRSFFAENTEVIEKRLAQGILGFDTSKKTRVARKVTDRALSNMDKLNKVPGALDQEPAIAGLLGGKKDS
jgi:hypothetical protein